MPVKSIVAINTSIPTVEHELSYESQGSLRDYDIAVFSPKLPYQERVEFSGGGSCISIEGTKKLAKAISHWAGELSGALAAGKTVFIVLGEYEEDSGATGSTLNSRTSRTYQTSTINNYSAIPGGLKVENARGRSIVVKDGAYRGLYEVIKSIAEYRVVFDPAVPITTLFTAKDGTVIGGIAKLQGKAGSMVLMPYFNFYTDTFIETGEGGGQVWNADALKVSRALIGQLVAIDKMLKGSSETTPAPGWLAQISRPKVANDIEIRVAEIDRKIATLHEEREREEISKASVLEYLGLLYETGKPLENAVEKALQLIGYSVGNFASGDLEIDHVIIGPSGKRMIGESEGKDTSAVDISKFRQLESNIGEDFERDEVDEPAKGLLFGNGYRLSPPSERAEQFTKKSLTNASRLGSALIQTADLYPVVLHLLDNPTDEIFKAACRAAIEDTHGGVVDFPSPGQSQMPVKDADAGSVLEL